MKQQTPLNGNGNGRRFTVKPWLIEAFKIALGAVIAIGTISVRITSDEKDIQQLKIDRDRAATLADMRSERSEDNARRIGIIEIKGALMEKGISDTLLRIETDVKEVKGDIKILQKNTVTK